jgi:hypothetical protein
MLNRLLLVLDVALLLTAGSLGMQLYRIWRETPAVAAAAQAAPAPATADAATPPAGAKPAASPTAFTVIAERNLFTPTRTELGPEPPKPVTATAAPIPIRPAEKPRLYGVVMGADGGSRAYLWDPQTKKVFGYKVGDSIADSLVENINADRVTMRRGSEVFEVLLRDPSKPRPVPAPVPVAVPGLPGQQPVASPQGPQPPISGVPAPTEATPPFGTPGPLVTPGQPTIPGQPMIPGLPQGPSGVTGPTVPPQRSLPFPTGRPQLRMPSATPPNVPPQPQPSGEAGS